jgi:FkbM family methyltransferase
VQLNNQKARLQLRKQSTDAEVAWQCFVAGQYEIPVVLGGPPIHRKAVQAKYLDIVGSGKKPLIVDCGANIGASTLWFKLRYPQSTVVAIEPAPDNFAALVANCAPYSEIEPIEAGIGPADSSAFLLDSGGGAWGYQTSTKPTSVKINMVSLETICATKPADEYTPFILKIDIEGAEKDLFEPSTYAAFQRFPVLIYESHDFYMPAKRTSSPFFRFHADTGRDFLFGVENVFSFDMPAITQKSG